MYKGYFDGVLKGNFGLVGVGIVIVNFEGRVILEYLKEFGIRINNEVEYFVFIEFL